MLENGSNQVAQHDDLQEVDNKCWLGAKTLRHLSSIHNTRIKNFLLHHTTKLVASAEWVNPIQTTLYCIEIDQLAQQWHAVTIVL